MNMDVNAFAASQGKINAPRLLDSLRRLSSIGQEEDGSITRIAFSPEYNQIVDSLYDEAQTLGFHAKKDVFSNLIITVPGQDATAKTIYVGSHLDTVKQGGRYDGLLGVLAGFECLKSWREQGIRPHHTVCLIGFNAEEGGELGGTFGSRAILGQVPLSDALVQSKLQKYHLSPEDFLQARIDTSKAQCYLELHVEQGGCLERARIPIGVVTGIVAIYRLNITCRGESNHAGTTPMDCRKDALVGMAHLILLAEKLAKESQGALVATTGFMEFHPNMANVIPGEVASSIDIRGMDPSAIQDFCEELRRHAAKIPEVSFDFKVAVAKEGSVSDSAIQDAIKAACRNREIPFLELPSGAGHDATAFAKCMPTGMIFVPSIGGKSHCKEEATKEQDIVTGAQILSDTIWRLDHMAQMP